MKRALAIAIVLVSTPAAADTLTVGPGKTYATPCAAIGAAHAGDVIAIDAGDYPGDHCAWSTDNLTVRGVGGRARIDAGKNLGNIANGKGIFVSAAAMTTFENLELSGAVADAQSKNGAGIRHEGTNLVVRNCYLHDNEDGILGSPAAAGTGSVLVADSELAANGNGDGQSHNLYLGHYASFEMTGSYSHDAKVGHLLKSRALANVIHYNVLDDGASDAVSYEATFPSAGRVELVGNLIVQTAAAGNNHAIIDYASEDQGNPDHRVYVGNNTIVNLASGGTFVQTAVDDVPAEIIDNILFGPGTVSSKASAVLTTNFQDDPKFVGANDYHLAAGSPCINAGTDPSVVPLAEPQTTLGTTPRAVDAKIDIGAFELGTPRSNGGGGNGGGTGTASDGGAGGASADGGTTSAAPTDGGGCALGGGGAPGLAGMLVVLLGLRRRKR